MSLELMTAYAHVRTELPAQVQGTCGLYSFYYAVQILRQLNSKYPAVPYPKKRLITTAAPLFATSLRQYAKATLGSGQGEILSVDEMKQLMLKFGYGARTATSPAPSKDTKKQFLQDCMKQNLPVLVAYNSDEGPDATAIYSTDKVQGAGQFLCAHWSLIIDINAFGAAVVVEPQRPQKLKVWPLDDLLRANKLADQFPFVQYWAKVVYDKDEFDRQVAKGKTPAPGARKSDYRGVAPVGDSKVGWAPSWDAAGNQGQAKLYDLGGVDTKGAPMDRHIKQALAHALVAVVPPAP
jgi:hypothetical protein